MELQKILEILEASADPAELRQFATKILRLADAIDQRWDPGSLRSNYPIFSDAARIERKSVTIAFAAQKEEYRAQLREEAIGIDLVGIPAWNILIELFKQFSGGAKVSTKSLQIIAKCPETTALRIIDRLEERGFVSRSQSVTDKRVTFVELTRTGVTKVGAVLEKFED